MKRINQLLNRRFEIFSKKGIKSLLLLVLTVLSLSLFQSLPLSTDSRTMVNSIDPEKADIAGSELFAEQLNAVVAGNNSLITHSMITNDSNIFNYFDLRDPAFLDASFMISTSNGKRPATCPLPMGNNTVPYVTAPFIGFIYFENTTNTATLQRRLDRVKKIITDNLYIDIIFTEPIQNSSFGYYYPFVGDYPNDWARLSNIFLGNLPKDGLWGTVDESKVFSSEYISTHYLGLSIIHVSNINSIRKVFEYDRERYSIIELLLQTIDVQNLIGSPELLSQGIGTFFGNGSNQDFSGAQGFSSLFGGLSSGISSYFNTLTYMNLQYEGNQNAVKKDQSENYTFSLFDALGYNKTTLKVSEKTFISLIGALLSTISVKIYTAEILQSSPNNFMLSDYNLKKIELALFLLGQGSALNISQIRQYSFGTKWTQSGPLTQFSTYIRNLNNTLDPVNFLQFTGFGNFPILLQGLLDPLPDLKVQFRIKNESSLIITKTLSNASNAVVNRPIMNITVSNPNAFPVYGQEMNLTMLGISNRMLVPPAMNPVLAGLGIDPELAFPDYNARFFLIDTYGTGLYDNLYPSITNPAQLLPYSPYMADQIEANRLALILLGFSNAQIDQLKLSVSSPLSIFNPDNWVLQPGESFNISVTNLNVSTLDIYRPFHETSMEIINGTTPLISYGQQVSGTVPMNTRIKGSAWNITTQSIEDSNLIEVYASFKNETFLDIFEHALDGLSFQMNFSTSSTPSVNFEIWDLLENQFVSYPVSQTSQGWNLSINNVNTNLSNYVDENNNFSVLVRVAFNFNEPSRLDIFNFNLTYLERDLSVVELNPSAVVYSTESGNNTYISRSNALRLGTGYLGSILATQYISSYNSYSGQPNTYILNVKNIGNKEAKNINITVRQPGIIRNLKNHRYVGVNESYRMIADAGNFTYDSGYLNFTIPLLLPGQSVNNLSFDFFTPNSEIIQGAIIEWDNYRKYLLNSSDFRIQANDVYLSAPIVYASNLTRPYTHTVQFSYKLNLPANEGVRINSTANITIGVLNCGNESIDFLRIKLPRTLEGLMINGIEGLYISNLSANQLTEINFSVSKSNYRGYFLSPIEGFSALGQFSIRSMISTGLLLGSVNLTIERIIPKFDMVKGERAVVLVRVRNNGNIEAGNLTINDLNGYHGLGFGLIEGSPIGFVDNLNPGETYEFNHTILAKNQGWYNISSTKIVYYFISRTIFQNELQTIKIRENILINAGFVYVPVIIGLLGLFLFKKYKESYNLEEMELQRKEMLLFGDDLMSRAWDKENLTKFLNRELKKTEEALK